MKKTKNRFIEVKRLFIRMIWSEASKSFQGCDKFAYSYSKGHISLHRSRSKDVKRFRVLDIRYSHLQENIYRMGTKSIRLIERKHLGKRKTSVFRNLIDVSLLVMHLLYKNGKFLNFNFQSIDKIAS